MLVALVDQLTKLWVVDLLMGRPPVDVVDGFIRLVYVRNYGAAFGFLNDASTQWQTWFFVGTAVITACILLWMLRTLPPAARAGRLGIGLVLGGALGNVIDRIRIGYVIDFLDVYVGRYHWPAFNVADAGITVGACLLAYALLTAPEPAKTNG